MSAFIVSRSDSVVTPESAEYGDYDYELSGFIAEDIPMDCRELARELEGADLKNTNGQDFYFEPWEDYRTGHSHSECVHVECDSFAAVRALNRVCRIVEARLKPRIETARKALAR